MPAETTQLRRATPQDLETLRSLLKEVNLPIEGVADHLSGFFAWCDDHHRIMACAGVERHGTIGLLRSVAVAPHLQRSGIGHQVVEAVIDQARREGMAEIVLLTTTARDFFARRFQFTEAPRVEYGALLANSPEWNLPRCSSAVFMKLALTLKPEHKP